MSQASLLPAASGGEARERLVVDHARHADDWYVDPPWCTELLLRAVDIDGPTWDPCCGGGSIVGVLRAYYAGKYGLGVRASDIVDRGCPGAEHGVDFLACDDPAYNIVFNPPYKRAEEFILHAISLAEGLVCALVNIKFLASQGRRERLFLPHPPAAVLILSRRPSMPPGGAGLEAKGGTADYCWIVWHGAHGNHDHRGTQMRWLA